MNRVLNFYLPYELGDIIAYDVHKTYLFYMNNEINDCFKEYNNITYYTIIKKDIQIKNKAIYNLVVKDTTFCKKILLSELKHKFVINMINNYYIPC